MSSTSLVPAEVKQQRLPSGLSLLVETVPESELAGVALIIDAGAIRDPRGKEGLAHWVEHLAFRARHRGEPAIERKLDAASASWNGFTSHDVVGYFAFAAKAELPKLAQIAVDLMSQPLAGVSEHVYEHERRVVEAERGFRSDHAPGQVQDWIYQSVFAQQHPYARPVGGTGSSIGQLTQLDAEAFVSANYRPERMTLYVLAPRDVPGEAIVKKALGLDLSGPRQATPTPAPASARPMLQTGQLVRRAAAVPAPELWLTWPLPAETRVDRARAEMLATVVDTGAAPTFESDRAIASGSCFLDRGKLQWLMSCRVLLNDSADLDATISHVLTGLRGSVTASPYQRDWFWRVKRRFVLERALEEEKLEARSIDFASNARQFGDALEGRGLSQSVAALEFADVGRAGFPLMERNQTYLTLVEPLPADRLVPAVPLGLASPLDMDDGSVDIDTDPARAVQTLPRRDLASASSFKLPSGLTVLVKQRKTPFLSAILGFRGGSSWLNRPSVARAAEAAETWGWIDPDPISWGIELRRERGRDDHWYATRSLGGSLEKTLQVLEATKNARVEWPSSDFRRLLPTLQRYDDAPENRSARAVTELLYADHPYAKYVEPAQIDGVPVQAVRSLFSAIHRPERGALVVVGDVDPDDVRLAADAAFGRWQAEATEPLTLPRAQLQPSSTVVSVQHRPASLQADLSLTCLLPFETAQDFAVAEVLSDVLGRVADKQLRRLTGAAYFAVGSVRPDLAKSARVELRTSVANPHLDAALALFGRLLRSEGTHVSDALFERSRYEVIRGSVFDGRRGQDQAFQLYSGWLLGLSAADLDRTPQIVAGLSVTQVQAALDACLPRAVLGIVGDEPTVRKSLREAEVPVLRLGAEPRAAQSDVR